MEEPPTSESAPEHEIRLLEMLVSWAGPEAAAAYGSADHPTHADDEQTVALMRHMLRRTAHGFSELISLLDMYQRPELVARQPALVATCCRLGMRLLERLFWLTGDKVIKKELYPLRAIVEDAYWAALSPSACHEGLSFTYAGPPELTVMVDRKGLICAFREVLQNAIRHGWTDSATSATNTICVNVGRSSDSSGRNALRVEIRDTGRGFRADQVRVATLPFYCARQKGVGLGLAVARRIIEAHGGAIQILPSSPAEAGGRVVVFLPSGPDLSIGSQ